MEQAKQGGNETAPETAGYYRGAGCFSLKAAELNELLGVGRCFDMTGRDLSIGGRQARLWVVNGYAQDDLLERVIARVAGAAGPEQCDRRGGLLPAVCVRLRCGG